jgi:hypothetical protein
MEKHDNLLIELEEFYGKCRADKMPDYKRAVFINLIQSLFLKALEERNSPDYVVNYFKELLLEQQDTWKITGMMEEIKRTSIRIELAPYYRYEGNKEIIGQLLDVVAYTTKRGQLRKPFGKINVLTIENSVAGISFNAIKNIELI